MSESITLQRGTAAEELLQHEAFITCVNDLYNQYITEITGSTLDDGKTREQRFFQIRALQEISTELKSWVQAKDLLLVNHEEE